MNKPALTLNEADVFIGNDVIDEEDIAEVNTTQRETRVACCTIDDLLEDDVPEHKHQAFTYVCVHCDARLMPSEIYKLGSPCCNSGKFDVDHACARDTRRDSPASYKNHTPCCNNDAVGVYHPRWPTSRNLATHAPPSRCHAF